MYTQRGNCQRRTISVEILGKKERKKQKESSCFQISVLASVRHKEHCSTGGEEEGKVKRKRINDDVSDVAHERPFIRPQRDIYWGKRVRGKEERPDEDYVICIW